MREMSEPKQLAVIRERNSCFDKGESGQSLSCTSTTGARALLLLQAALAEQLSVPLESGRREHDVHQLSSSVPGCSLCSGFPFSVGWD